MTHGLIPVSHQYQIYWVARAQVDLDEHLPGLGLWHLAMRELDVAQLIVLRRLVHDDD